MKKKFWHPFIIAVGIIKVIKCVRFRAFSFQRKNCTNIKDIVIYQTGTDRYVAVCMWLNLPVYHLYTVNVERTKEFELLEITKGLVSPSDNENQHDNSC